MYEYFWFFVPDMHLHICVCVCVCRHTHTEMSGFPYSMIHMDAAVFTNAPRATSSAKRQPVSHFACLFRA